MFTVGNEVNSITFSPENYIDAEKMWIDINEQIQILMRGGYIAVIRMEDDLVVIEYETDEFVHAYGLPNPVWLTFEQVMELSPIEEGEDEY